MALIDYATFSAGFTAYNKIMNRNFHRDFVDKGPILKWHNYEERIVEASDAVKAMSIIFASKDWYPLLCTYIARNGSVILPDGSHLMIHARKALVGEKSDDADPV